MTDCGLGASLKSSLPPAFRPASFAFVLNFRAAPIFFEMGSGVMLYRGYAGTEVDFLRRAWLFV